mgnify:CR=1 FL=1
MLQLDPFSHILSKIIYLINSEQEFVHFLMETIWLALTNSDFLRMGSIGPNFLLEFTFDLKNTWSGIIGWSINLLFMCCQAILYLLCDLCMSARVFSCDLEMNWIVYFTDKLLLIDDYSLDRFMLSSIWPYKLLTKAFYTCGDNAINTTCCCKTVIDDFGCFPSHLHCHK